MKFEKSTTIGSLVGIHIVAAKYQSIEQNLEYLEEYAASVSAKGVRIIDNLSQSILQGANQSIVTTSSFIKLYHTEIQTDKFKQVCNFWSQVHISLYVVI